MFRLGLGHMGLASIDGGLPSWLPLGTGNVAPLLYADFAAGNYWYNGLIYVSFASFMTAIGGVFSRASSATYFDSAGVLQTAGNGVARFVYDPVSHASLGLRLTGARTNLALSSGAVGDARWSLFNSATGVLPVVVLNAAVAPDGTTTASDITVSRTTTAGVSTVYQPVTTVSGSRYMGSVWLKAKTAGDIGKQIDLLQYDGTVRNATTVTLTAAWVRYSISGATVLTSVTGEPIDMGFNNAGATTQTGSVGFYAWGAQGELGPFASDYIATTSASATEAADSMIIGPTGGVPFTGFSASAGTYLAVGIYDQVASADAYMFDTTSGERTPVLMNSAAQKMEYGIQHSSSFSVLSNGSHAVTAGASTKVAVAFRASDFQAYLNGASDLTSAAAVMGAPSTLKIGTNDGGGSPLFGNMNKFAYWPSRLSNADLQRLST